MTAQVTLDEVWRLFKATDERIASLNAATDQRIVSLNEEANRRHAETEAAMARSRGETEALIARSRAETEAALRDLSRQMGRFSNQLGEFAESMVVPAARKIFLSRGIPVHSVSRNIDGNRNGKAIEVDILVVNKEHAVAVEVKNRPTAKHVNEHLERLAIFKEIFPIYQDYKLLGAIAGISFDDNVASYAYRQGLFVLGQSGETVTILNDDRFQPTVW